MGLALDERQEWGHACRRLAERAAVLHQELVAAGHHQDQCYLMTRYFVQQELDRLVSGQPELDNAKLNSLLGEMQKHFQRFLGSDDD